MAIKKKTPAATITPTTKLSNFTSRVLKDLNKTEKQIQEESVENFRLDAIIDTKMCISTLETATIPRLNNDLIRAQRNLETAEKDYEKTRFSTANNYNTYLSNRNSALGDIRGFTDDVSYVKSQIREEEKQLAMYKEILADLS